MRKNVVWSLFIVCMVVIICSVGCGGKPAAVTQAQPTATVVPSTPTEPPAPTATAVPTGLITSLSDIKKATIQIESVGTFVDPQFGYMANQAGLGSGFIIDPSGLAVTNNHVGTANVGLEVYTAGYPLGDPEFTMTKGIISKEKANGDTSWASVEYVLEHDATINPGNSGGPLVDANARVVGVNYAGSSSTSQYFAIDRGTALPVINQLKTGADVESIGINGEAVTSDDGSFSGIWVSSIKSGSPADKTGVKAGDIIMTLENLSLATDGTMKDYCDILRTHNPTDTLSMEVLRWDTQEVLEGQLNGRNLAVSYAFGSTSTAEPGTAEPSSTETSGSYPANCESGTASGYMTCWDDTNNISVDVPEYWSDVNGTSWNFNGTDIGVAISAAPSLSDYENYYDAEGMFFGASETFAQIGGYVQFLDYYAENYKNDCTLVGRYDYNDGVYRGKYDQYTNCGGQTDYDTYLLSAVDIVDPTSKIILVEVTVNSADTNIVEQIWNTFYVYF
jgi:serine protease Do